MNKKALIETLELVEPALSTNNLVPIFSHFCFTPGQVYAFNDQIAIVAKCDVEDTFAVHGKTLLGLLRASSGTDIELRVAINDVVVGPGVKLPILTEKAFIFEAPFVPEGNTSWSIPGLINGIELCLTTASRDQTQLAIMGVFAANDHLYSCDGDSITRVACKAGQTGDGVLLSISFCESLVRDSVSRFVLLNAGKEWVIAHHPNGETELYGRVPNHKPFDYEGMIKKTLKAEPKYVPVPEGLKEALTRAWVVAEPDNAKTALKVNKNSLTVTTETALGLINDTVACRHPDVSANVSAGLVLRSLKVCDEMAIMDNCTAYRKGEGITQLVANMA